MRTRMTFRHERVRLATKSFSLIGRSKHEFSRRKEKKKKRMKKTLFNLLKCETAGRERSILYTIRWGGAGNASLLIGPMPS